MSDQNKIPKVLPQSDGKHFKHSYTPPTTIHPPMPKPSVTKSKDKPNK